MKMLITGASGFIGNALAKYLYGHNDVIMTDIVEPIETYGHTFIRADLSNKEEVDKLPDAAIVFHMAAYNHTEHFYTRPYDVIKNTLVPTQNLVERYKNTDKFVYASSSEIYAGGVELGVVDIPTSETNIAIIDGIDNPRWSYASSKLMGEMILHSSHVQNGTNYLIVRFHNVYGKQQRNHFIPEYAKRLKDGDNRLYGANQTRAFVYIDDAIKILYDLSVVAMNDTVNIGNPTEVSVSEVATHIRDLLNVSDPPIFADAPKGSVSRRCPNVDKMISYLGKQEFTSIDEGIRLTLM